MIALPRKIDTTMCHHDTLDDSTGPGDGLGTRLWRSTNMQSQNIKTKSSIMQSTLDHARAYATRGKAPILILGETGTGKTHLAEQIHAWTGRTGPFEVFDCGAVSASLIESELFGHVKGAFTGADRARKGIFERAEGGTIFLDEIGELPLDLQPRLLRVVQEGVIRPVGGDSERPIDVRIVAATNRNLTEEVQAGRFRADLNFRLSQLTVTVPPLHERAEDIPDLVSHFNLPDDVVKVLKTYRWPGNVRELLNFAEKIIILDCNIDQVKTKLAELGRKPSLEIGTIKTMRDDRWLCAVALSELRKEAGGWWTASELAARTEVHRNTITNDIRNWLNDGLLKKRGCRCNAQYSTMMTSCA